MTTSTDPFQGMSPEDKARAQAYQANQRSIALKRQKAARDLLAPKGPAKAVRDAWAPVTGRSRARRAD